MMAPKDFTGAVIDGIKEAESLKIPSKEVLSLAKLEAICKHLEMSKTIKDILVYLLENQVRLKGSSFYIRHRGTGFSPFIYVELFGCDLAFCRAQVMVTREVECPYMFIPHSTKHFFDVLDILKKLPRGLDPETREKLVSAAETYPGVPIEEILALIKLKST